MTPLRLAVCALVHESNALVGGTTPLSAFARLSGDELAGLARSTGTEVAGALLAADAAGAEAAATTVAMAVSSGPVESAAATELCDELLSGVARYRDDGGLDAVVVCLHGSMCSEDDDDVEGTLLTRLRLLVGDDVAVVATLDWHCSITQPMVDGADALVAYRTYPHVDQVDRGAEAAGIALDLAGGAEVAASWIAVPMLIAGPQTRHEASAMAEVLSLGERLARDREVRTWSVCPGFARSDNPGSGAHVYVAAQRPEAARQAAVALAGELWDRRHRFAPETLAVDQAVARALELVTAGSVPVVLSDQGDNPGAGAPGDGTTLLSALLDAPLEGAVVASLHAPAAVEACHAAGVGADIAVVLGAGGPGSIEVAGSVDHVGDGAYTMRSPTYDGVPVDVGPLAVLRAASGLRVVLTSTRVQNQDLELLRHVGIEPTDASVLAVKSNAHFRAAFGPIAAEILDVDTPGPSTPHLERLPYHRVRRPVHPLDDVAWAPA